MCRSNDLCKWAKKKLVCHRQHIKIRTKMRSSQDILWFRLDRIFFNSKWNQERFLKEFHQTSLSITSVGFPTECFFVSKRVAAFLFFFLFCLLVGLFKKKIKPVYFDEGIPLPYWTGFVLMYVRCKDLFWNFFHLFLPWYCRSDLVYDEHVPLFNKSTFLSLLHTVCINMFWFIQYVQYIEQEERERK